MKSLKALILFSGICMHLSAQITTGNIIGTIRMQFKPVHGAKIILMNLANGNQLFTNSNHLGQYHFDNLLPSSQYQILFIAEYADTLLIESIEVRLGNTIKLDAILTPSINVLQPITVIAKVTTKDTEKNKHFSLVATTIEDLAINGRNYLNLLKYLPTANTGAAGAVSFSGQNNRYNSLYIDGALQNDVFGLSATGTYGGLAESAPVSIEMIEQLQLQLSPYDASLGGYTGAALNMITKSGKNKPYSSIYRYSGLQKGIFNNTGIVISGPIKENQLFFFANADYTREERIEENEFTQYIGNTNNELQFQHFISTVKSTYNYNPGNIHSFYQKAAAKFALRLDYFISNKHRINVSLRKNIASKESTGNNSTSVLFFSNNGKRMESSLFTGSLEINSKINAYTFNQFYFSYSKSVDEILFLGTAFPSVTILDGDGLIFLGSNEDAQETSTKQNNWNIRNKFSYHKGKKMISAGVELEWNKINNQFLQNTFGSYFYFSVTDFLNNKKPGGYEINYPSGIRSTYANNYKTAFFMNVQWKIKKNISLHTGIRMSFQQLTGNTKSDSLTNELVLPTITSYYPTNQFSYGKNPSFLPSISPRLSFSFQFPRHSTTIDIGTGFFVGRMPLAWMSSIYFHSGVHYDYFEASGTVLNRIRFEKNILQQWKPSQVGSNGNKGVLNLIAPNLLMPSVWRSSIELRKQIKEKWQLQMDAMYYYNVEEIAFSNLNLLPPQDTMEGPDHRLIYANTNKGRIPILADSSNPYEQIILMSNNVSQHGYGYRFGLKINGAINNITGSMQYSYGESYSVFDGNYSVLINQWKLNENTNGRNNLQISKADFSPGHLIQFWVKKEFKLRKQKLILSFAYTGKSGNGFSYVYGKKNMARDEPTTTGYDLLYVPTSKELLEQRFIPLETNNMYYTPDQQKEALEWYIETDPYLRKSRGNYAERNGSRSAFTHQMDIKIAYNKNVLVNKRKYGLNFSLDIINLANLINAQWARNTTILGNRIKLINFEGFLSNTPLIPQYSFNPMMVEHQKNGLINLHSSQIGSEWQIQLGMRINFY